MTEPTLTSVRRVHMVGIGGSGMSALASLLLQMGRSVTGSDMASGSTIEQLRAAGARVFETHDPANVGDAEYVVRSSAVRWDNPEVQEAERLGLPNRKLAEAVGELMHEREGVAVAGTHGKTTTTALVTWLFDRAGLDPLGLIGADTPAYHLGARAGEGPMVVEADEFDRRFLNYWPEVIVVTGIEADHLDYYRDLAEIRAAFQTLVERLPPHGRLVVCADDPCAASLTSPARRETYGFASDADWRIDDYVASADKVARFTLQAAGRAWPVESPLIGEHNARNAAAAIAVADHFGIGLAAARAAVTSFEAPRRRFETVGRPRGIRVIDDYGHHPTEVATVLRSAAQIGDGDVWVVFQPHTTHRTAVLLDQFARAFGDARHTLILPIYHPSGRDEAASPITSSDLVAAIARRGHTDVREVDSFEAAEETLAREAKPGDLVITMGAGDVTLLSRRLVERLGA